MPDGTVLFSRMPTRLEDVPVQYQASVYATNERERRAKNDEKKKKNLDLFRAQLKTLKGKLLNATTTSNLTEQQKEIAALEKAIKKAPKAKRKWSPILSGSFEAKK